MGSSSDSPTRAADATGDAVESTPTPEQLGVGQTKDVSPVARQVLLGTVAGVVAWIGVYAATLLFYRAEIEGAIVSEAVSSNRIAGLLLYNAHTVPAEVIHPYDLSSHDFLAAGAGSPVLYLLPPILLALSGLFVAVYAEPSTGIGANVLTGGTIVFGYALCSLVGIFVFTASSGDTQFRPDPTGAILLAGLLYPLAFGALGGFAAAFVDSD